MNEREVHSESAPRTRWQRRLALALLGCSLMGCAAPQAAVDGEVTSTVDHAAMGHVVATSAPSTSVSGAVATPSPTPSAEAAAMPSPTPSVETEVTPSPTPSVEAATTASPGVVAHLAGSGEGTSAEFRLQPGLATFTIKHPTDTPFAVYLMNAKGDHLALLANATRAVDGSRAYGVEQEDMHYLHVIATDAWEAEVAQPAEPLAASGSAPASIEGLGPAATAPFTLEAGTETITWRHSGETPFTLLLLDAAGKRIATVAENSTAKSGEMAALIPAAGVYLLDVGADGEWSLTLSP